MDQAREEKRERGVETDAAISDQNSLKDSKRREKLGGGLYSL